MGIFICPHCGNQDEKYIGYRNNIPYCRKCISFKGLEVNKTNNIPKNASIVLSYSLSDDQKNLSNRILSNYKDGKNTLIHAVCGSGKTEIVLEVISYAIKCGDKVAFCIPRRDVVIEIAERLKSIFTFNSVISVYGGHTDKLEADIVCLTTHQLYRYPNYFDLIVLDEIDAFPFAGSDVLNSFFYKASKGNVVLMSATPPKEIVNKFLDNGEILSLNKRFHRHLLPVPNLIISKTPLIYLILLKQLSRFLKETKQVFIFAPTIDICDALFKFINLFIKGGNSVHSKKKDRPIIIQDFKDKKYRFLVTTAVLERGVTVKDLQVIVFKADHFIYQTHTLVQISGRVGRKIDAPEGEVIYLANKKTIPIEESIEQIESSNKDLQNLF